MINFPLWTAVVTPMLTDGSIDYVSFERLLAKQNEAGNGILILGSTGEGLNLTAEEKRSIIKFTIVQKLDVPIMVGIGGFLLDQQKALIQFADEQGVDAFLLVNPLYAKPKKEGQLAWFSALMETTPTRCMIYNVPSRTGSKIDPWVLGELDSRFDHLMGIKEASGSVEEFKAFREVAPQANLYCGDDNLIEPFVREGAVGHVSVAANAWPKETKWIVEQALKGNSEALYPEWVSTSALLFHAPNPIPVKHLMKLNGDIDFPDVRLPLSLGDLSDSVQTELQQANERLLRWFEPRLH